MNAPNQPPNEPPNRNPRVVRFPGAPVAPAPRGLLEDPRTHQALLLIGGILVIFTRLWETTLASYDDTYYAEKAKEILLTGDWLVPHWNQQPTFDNTPLYLWVTAILFRLFGISEFTARFLSAAAGVGCILLTYHMGRRLFGHWVGFLAGTVLLTTPYFLKYSRHAMLDTTQTLLVGTAILLLVRGVDRDRTLAIDAGAGLCIGLAVLNKSLLGYLPLAVYAVWVVVARVPRQRALRPSLLAVAGIGVLFPATWFTSVWARHGRAFLDEHFGRILWQRALQGEPGQSITWTSYLGYVTGLFENFLPWIFLALWGVWKLWRADEAPRRALLPICWVATTVGLLSLSAAQKSWYVMPAYPALAILAGYGLNALLARRERARAIYAGSLAGLLLVFLVVVVVTPLSLSEDRNRDVAIIAPAARAAVPPGKHVFNFNLSPHWRYVSPLLFYSDRPLALPVTDLDEMAALVRTLPDQAFLTNRETHARLVIHMAEEPPVLAASGDLVLLGPLAPSR